MTKRTVITGGALLALVVAVGLVLRPGNDPVAASQAAAPIATTPSTSEAIARLGNQQVAADELKALFAALPADSRAQLRGNRSALEGWIRARLAEKAVLEQADAQGWRQRPEVAQATRLATEQIVFRDYLASVSQVPDDYPSERDLQNAFDAGKANWQTPALYRVSQIYLAVPEGQSPDAVRKQAQELAKRAQAAPNEFTALAVQYSQERDPVQRGVDAGLQPLQQLVPEVRVAISKLKVGAVADPVQSPAGFHILKLNDMQAAREASFGEMRERLRLALRTQRQEQIAKAYLDGVINTATLSIDGAMLNKVLEDKL